MYPTSKTTGLARAIATMFAAISLFTPALAFADVFTYNADTSYSFERYDGSWATARAGGTGTPRSGDNANFVEAYSSGSDAELDRAVVYFDRAENPQTVSDATVDLYVSSRNCGVGGSFTLVAATTADAGAFTSGDYSIAFYGSTPLSDALDCADLTTGAFHTFTLNAAGISYLESSQYVKFGIRSTYDIENNSPGGFSRFGFSGAANGTSAQRPFLTVTTAAPPPPPPVSGMAPVSMSGAHLAAAITEGNHLAQAAGGTITANASWLILIAGASLIIGIILWLVYRVSSVGAENRRNFGSSSPPGASSDFELLQARILQAGGNADKLATKMMTSEDDMPLSSFGKTGGETVESSGYKYKGTIRPAGWSTYTKAQRKAKGWDF